MMTINIILIISPSALVMMTRGKVYLKWESKLDDWGKPNFANLVCTGKKVNWLCGLINLPHAVQPRRTWWVALGTLVTDGEKCSKSTEERTGKKGYWINEILAGHKRRERGKRPSSWCDKWSWGRGEVTDSRQRACLGRGKSWAQSFTFHSKKTLRSHRWENLLPEMQTSCCQSEETL